MIVLAPLRRTMGLALEGCRTILLVFEAIRDLYRFNQLRLGLGRTSHGLIGSIHLRTRRT